MDRLFKDVGRSVQIFGLACMVLGLAGVVTGIIMLCVGGDELIAAISLGAGVVLMISSLPIYAFGQITRDVREIKESLSGNVAFSFDDLPEL